MWTSNPTYATFYEDGHSAGSWKQAASFNLWDTQLILDPVYNASSGQIETHLYTYNTLKLTYDSLASNANGFTII